MKVFARDGVSPSWQHWSRARVALVVHGAHAPFVSAVTCRNFVVGIRIAPFQWDLFHAGDRIASNQCAKCACAALQSIIGLPTECHLADVGALQSTSHDFAKSPLLELWIGP